MRISSLLLSLFNRRRRRGFPLNCGKAFSQMVRAKLPESTELRNLPNFNSISVSHMIDLEFTQGPDQLVEVTACHDVMSMISTVVVAGELRLSVKGSFVSGKRPKVICSAPELVSIKRSGSGRIFCANLSCDTLAVEKVGSGEVSLCGDVKNLSATIKGTGSVDCSKLEIGSLKVLLFGSGWFEGEVVNSIDCFLQGSGKICIENKPKSVRVEQHGSGAIRIGGEPVRDI